MPAWTHKKVTFELRTGLETASAHKAVTLERLPPLLKVELVHKSVTIATFELRPW